MRIIGLDNQSNELLEQILLQGVIPPLDRLQATGLQGIDDLKLLILFQLEKGLAILVL